LNGTPKEELSEKERYVEDLKNDYQTKKKREQSETPSRR
jgi:hypothetical protein